MTKDRITRYRENASMEDLDAFLKRDAVLSAMYLCCPGRRYDAFWIEIGEHNAIDFWRHPECSRRSGGIVFG